MEVIKKELKVTFILVLIIFLLLVVTGCKLLDDKEDNVDNNDDSDKNGTVSKWDLWSNGTRLRGANIYQRRVYPELDGNEFMGRGIVGPVYTQEDFYRLSAMGANYVNISHPGLFSEDPPYKLSDVILNHLKNLVDMIGKADMFVVISFRTGPGRSEFTFFWGEDGDWFDKSYYNDSVWKNQTTQDAWLEMWKETARQFLDNQYVVGYDLMVEPNSNEVWFDIWEPSDFYSKFTNTIYDWNQLYPRITKAIREIDEEIPILIGGLGYSDINWFPYMRTISDTKIVYMIHQYAPFVYTHQEPGDQITYPGNFKTNYDDDIEYVDKNWLIKLFRVMDNFKTKNNLTTGCNEYGVVRWVPGGSVFMDDLMDLFEKREMNYALWVWDPFYGAYTSEVNAFNFRLGPDPNNTSEKNSSQLISVIKKYWSKNTYRPSKVNF